MSEFKPTVLYVEDDAGIRNELSGFIDIFSKKLHVACDGVEGLELYKQYKPDIVISDLRMPNMDGLDMSKEIKKINPEQYVIITTAYDDKDFLLESIGLSDNDYLLKPIDLKELENKITRYKK